MVRPPQAAVYLFLLDTTGAAVDSGYLKVICDLLLENLGSLPGDSRTQVGIICYDSAIRFFYLGGADDVIESTGDECDEQHQQGNVRMMTVVDVDDGKN